MGLFDKNPTREFCSIVVENSEYSIKLLFSE
jgi:hypothetical protein